MGNDENTVLLIDAVKVNQVNNFKYVGSFLTDDCRCEKEAKARIGIGKEAFARIKRTLCGTLDLQ